jgi:hypothetical protein
VTTAAGTSLVDSAKDSFTYGTNLALPATAPAGNTFQNLPEVARGRNGSARSLASPLAAV